MRKLGFDSHGPEDWGVATSADFGGRAESPQFYSNSTTDLIESLAANQSQAVGETPSRAPSGIEINAAVGCNEKSSTAIPDPAQEFLSWLTLNAKDLGAEIDADPTVQALDYSFRRCLGDIGLERFSTEEEVRQSFLARQTAITGGSTTQISPEQVDKLIKLATEEEEIVAPLNDCIIAKLDARARVAVRYQDEFFDKHAAEIDDEMKKLVAAIKALADYLPPVESKPAEQ